MKHPRSRHGRAAVLALGLATAAVGLATPAHAEPAPSTDYVTLVSGGADVLSHWDVANWGGIGDSNSCSGLPGLTVDDAEYDINNLSQGDAFDYGLVMRVGGNALAAPDMWDVEREGTGPDAPARAVTAAGMAADGLDATVEYRTQTGSQTLRTLLWLTNDGDTAVDTTVNVATNVGSDGRTAVRGSSDGDTVVTDADRWVVTSDNDTSPGDPVNTHVLAGPGDVTSAPTGTGMETFSCAGVEGVETDFAVSVPAGETRGLMFVNELSPTNEQALTDAARFSGDLTGTELFAGLSQAQQRQLLNWDVADTTAPESAAGAVELTNKRVVDVSYEAADDDSGVASVDLYVRQPHTDTFELVATDETNSGHVSYEATRGGKFGFYTRATDAEGNTEDAPATADAVTRVDLRKPPVRSRMGAPIVFDISEDKSLELKMRVRQRAHTSFTVRFDGQPVRHFDMGVTPQGIVSTEWFGRSGGRKVPSGRYVLVMKAVDLAGNRTTVRTLMHISR